MDANQKGREWVDIAAMHIIREGKHSMGIARYRKRFPLLVQPLGSFVARGCGPGVDLVCQ